MLEEENTTERNFKDEFNNNPKLKMATYAVGGALVIVLGYFLYKQFVHKPAEEKSKSSSYEGLNYAAKDSTDLAIPALKKSVDQFDGKVGGEVAQFTLARQYMAKADFKKALEELEGVNLNDGVVSAMAIALQGDCYSEMKKYQEAADMYIKAAEVENNETNTPKYYFKAALCAEELKDFETAKTLYQKIVDEYPSFSDTKQIKKYVGRVTKKLK